ncbi:M28 family peptidase [Flavihumibacter rivuli]|uniref:M28 family peptidase n=1 Tax=Flavihumibacter rivuli TaxID=2838156 RepID=UPI001BDE802D|nr:M28 family peptidase [Flavihumibacter rivuli]ULQ56709.1 M28 family peptidase [Flavihumibacter rivuli]
MKRIILVAVAAATCLVSQAQTETEKVRSTVSKANIEGHVYFLASDELRGRETGKPEIDIAAAYLANTLRRYSVKPVPGLGGGYYQEVPFVKTSAATRRSFSLEQFSTDKIVTVEAANINYDGPVVFLNYGTEADFKAADVKGKLVLTKAGMEGKTDPNAAIMAGVEKRKLASQYGAVGLVEWYTASENLWSQLAHYFNEDKLALKNESQQSSLFPHCWVLDADGNQAKASEGQKALKGSMQVEGVNVSTLYSRNVIGMVEGTDPVLKNEFVIYSAHYDHVGVGKPNADGDSIYNGARDNAIGSVTVLSAAENIARYPTKRSALFIFFTAEEKGLLGSKWYVEHPVLPLKQMVYCFNSDNASYNDTTKISVVGLGRTTAKDHIHSAAKEFGLQAIDDPAPEQGLFDRSDNVHFARKGVPAPTFSLGFTSFNEEVLKYYHQVTDNPDNLNYDYLTKFFRAYVLACRKIANDPKTPVWIKGDKYEPAAQKLYGK